MPIDRGWWLVAYLTLVGGLAQVALGGGLAVLARATGGRPYGPATLRAQLALYNLGVVLVAVADMAAAPLGVLAGSIVLIVALGLYAAALQHVVDSGQRAWPVGTFAYGALLTVLAGSVVVGTALAGALPGQ